MNAHEKAAHDLLMAAVKEDGQPRDMDSAYREMLDECYSFKAVGGPFEYLQPSKVMEEMLPTDYRCGFADWLDSEQVTEIGDEYFDSKELEDIREQVADAMDSEITELEEEIEELNDKVTELEGESPDDAEEEETRDDELGRHAADIKEAAAELEEKQSILAAVKAYTF